jgi:hypothetical protein
VVIERLPDLVDADPEFGRHNRDWHPLLADEHVHGLGDRRALAGAPALALSERSLGAGRGH